MAHVLFDTLKFQEKLTDAGMLEKHAKAITIAQNDALCEAMDNGFATKSDIRNVQSDIGDVKSEIVDIKSDIRDMKSEISNVKSEIANIKSEVSDMKSEISDMKSEIVDIKSEISDLKSEIVAVKSEFKSELTREIGSVKTELHHLASHVKLHDWMLGTCLAGIGTILIKLFFG